MLAFHRPPEYRHVLRIPLEKVAPGSSPPKAENVALQQRQNSQDALDRVGIKTRAFFGADIVGHYRPSRKSAPPDASGEASRGARLIGYVCIALMIGSEK